MAVLSFASAALTFANVVRGALNGALALEARRTAYENAAGATYDWCERFRTAQQDALERVYVLLSSDACARQVAGVLSDTGRARFDFDALRNAYAGEAIEQAPSCIDILQTLMDELARELRAAFKTDTLLQFDFARLDNQITAAFIVEQNKLNLSKAVVEIVAGVSESPGSKAAIDASQDVLRELQTEVQKQFDARLQAVIDGMKSTNSYIPSEPKLQELLAEALSNDAIKDSPAILGKIYTNLTVCAERRDDFEATVNLAEEAVNQLPQEARTNTNLAVAKVKRGDPLNEVEPLIEKALSIDPTYRPALILGLGVKSEKDVASALALAGSYEWLEEDANGQYNLSNFHLRVGDSDKAIVAARRALELQESGDHRAWLGRLLIGVDLGDGNQPMNFKVRGIAEPDRANLEEGYALLTAAAEDYRIEGRKLLSDAAQVDACRALLRLDRDTEAQTILEKVLADATAEEALKAAYANLIELLLDSDPARALVVAEEAALRLPDEPIVLFERARAFAVNDRTQDAISDWDKVADDDDAPASLRRYALLWTAEALVRLGDIGGARKRIDGVDLHQDPVAVNVMARLIEQETGVESAKDWLLASEPEFGEKAGFYVIAGDFLRRRNYETESRAFYAKALDSLGGDPSGLTDSQLSVWMDAAYYSQDWKKCALVDWTATKDPDLRRHLGILKSFALTNLGQLEDALTEYQRLYDESPTDHDVVQGLTVCAYNLGRARAVLPQLEKYVHTGHGSSRDRMNLAALYALANDSQGSAREAAIALAESPDDKEVIAQYVGLMLRAGQVDAAVQQMQLYVEKFPESDAIQIWRGQPEELSERFLNEVFLPARERHETVASLYKERPLPIGSMAHALGRSYANLWQGIARGELGMPLQVARGNETVLGDLEAARKVSAVALDQSALLTLGMLNLLSALPNLFDDLHVPLSAVHSLSGDLATHEEPTIRYILETLEQHALTVVVDGPFDGSSPSWLTSQAMEVLSESDREAMLLSESRSLPLVSDDLGLRDLVRSHGAPAFGTRTIVELFHERGVIDDETYAASIIRLIKENYHFITFNGLVLAKAIQSDVSDADLLVRMLRRENADVPSFVPVFAHALCEVWCSDSTLAANKTKSDWTMQLMKETLVRGDEREAIRLVALLVECVIRNRPEALRPLLMASCTLSGLPDDFVVLMTLVVSRQQAQAVLKQGRDQHLAQQFIDAMPTTLANRVRRIIRRISEEEYSVLFGNPLIIS